MKFISKLIFVFYLSLNLFSQDENSVRVNFLAFWSDQSLKFDSVYLLNQNNSLEFQNLKFYVSDVQLLKKGKITYQEKESFHLIDFSDIQKTGFRLKNIPEKDCDELHFKLGIDSATNFSGALGGDLDPTKGMYWTWQNGYINFKLEGTSNLCETRNNEFVFHLGGHLHPFNSLQELKFPISEVKNEILLKLDVKKFISKIDLTKTNHIMSPSLEAVKLSENVKSAFSLIQQ
ncbi:MAG: MbnP family protein [Bacteroidota bacterium]